MQKLGRRRTRCRYDPVTLIEMNRMALLLKNPCTAKTIYATAGNSDVHGLA